MGTCVGCGASIEGDGTLCEQCCDQTSSATPESLLGYDALADDGPGLAAGPESSEVPLQSPWRKYLRPALAVGGALVLVGGAFVVFKLYKNGRLGGVEGEKLLTKADSLLDSAQALSERAADVAKPANSAGLRLTKAVREQLLALNEGFTWSTHNSQRNFTEDRLYTIVGGQLHILAKGKTSWADSRYVKEWIATPEEVHRFLRNVLWALDTDGIA